MSLSYLHRVRKGNKEVIDQLALMLIDRKLIDTIIKDVIPILVHFQSIRKNIMKL